MKFEFTQTENVYPTRGDTFSFRFSITGTESMALEPDEAYFSVKRTSSDSYVLQKSLNNGITLFDEITNEDSTITKIYKVRVAPEDTQNLPLEKYLYDLELTFGNDRYTPLKGNFNLTYDVTRRTSNG